MLSIVMYINVVMIFIVDFLSIKEILIKWRGYYVNICILYECLWKILLNYVLYEWNVIIK